jgi:signal peptidase I
MRRPPEPTVGGRTTSVLVDPVRVVERPAGPVTHRAGRRRVDHGRRPPGRVGFRWVLADAALVVVLVLIFQLAVRTFLVQTYYVPSGSMENTLKRGDVLVVSVLSARIGTPNRGDVVVFRDPGGWLLTPSEPQGTASWLASEVLAFVGMLPSRSGESLVKRVIGIAEDTVACDDQGKLTVNGVPVVEPYLYPGDRACEVPFQVTVPASSVWVMGDHRSNSSDSRYNRAVNDGAVPVENLVGRVVAVVAEGRIRRP